MKTYTMMIALLCVSALMFMGGCGPKPAATEPAKEQKAEPAKEQKAELAAVPAAPEAPAAPAAEAAAPPAPAGPADPLQEKLFGTSWKVDVYTLNFLDAQKVKISGGKITQLFPTGADAKYTFAKDEKGVGNITLSLLGLTQKGTWDGEKLVIQGKEGERLSGAAPDAAAPAATPAATPAPEAAPAAPAPAPEAAPAAPAPAPEAAPAAAPAPVPAAQ